MNKFNTKTIKELKNKILYICAIKHDFEGGHIKSVERFVEATDKLEAFIIKALKAQEQEHQKKLEELKRLCDKERRGFLKTIERLKK